MPRCPLLDASTDAIAGIVGMRLSRIVTLNVHGRTTGCRIYALQNSALHSSEHLPGPKQPAIEIMSATYASPRAANNALVTLERQTGHHPQQERITPTIDGLCFQTIFDPQDNGADWACAYSHESTLIQVKTVVLSPALNALEVAQLVATSGHI